MRIVQMLQLEQNPELIRQYRYFHSPEGIWPEILQGIKDSGILEMEIYLLDHYLCMIVDLPEHLSWEEAMDRMAKAPRQTEWEAFVAQFQRAAANARSDEKWQRMERIFHLYPTSAGLFASNQHTDVSLLSHVICFLAKTRVFFLIRSSAISNGHSPSK